MIEKLKGELLRGLTQKGRLSLLMKRGMLVSDAFNSDFTTAKTYLVITPGGMTCQLQVPDAVNKPFTDYVICTQNGSCLNCPVKPAGNMISLSQALLDSGFRMLGMTFHTISFSRFLRKCCASSDINGTEDDHL